MTLNDVHKKFPTEDSCLDFLEAKRWPYGTICVGCNSKNVVKMIRTMGGRNKRNRIYQCRDCSLQFSTTSGTLFHDSHMPLTKWFLAISLILDSKKGMSANQLKRHLGVHYRTAWHVFHRIREAMQEGFMADGHVEMDETFLDGRKVVVFGIKERGGKMKLIHAPDAKAVTAKNLVETYVSKNAKAVYTDCSVIYDSAIPWKMRDRHRTINHSLEYVHGNIHINGVESAFSLFKRGLVGTYHQLSTKHLSRYLTEFEYKQNHKNDADLFSSTLWSMLNKPKLTYSTLTSSSGI